jgi:monoamine oxidase
MPRREKKHHKKKYIKQPASKSKRARADALGSDDVSAVTSRCIATRKVIIVGGGAAGIAAAYQLLNDDEHISVHLFESRGVYGGRARTDRSISGFAFDMGAQYLQDPAINPWVKIASDLGFELAKEDSGAYLRVNQGEGDKKENDKELEPDEMRYAEGSERAHDANWCDLAVGGEVAEVSEAIEESYRTAKEYPNRVVAGRPRFDTQVELFGHATSPYGPFSESAEVWQYIAADRARQYDADAGGEEAPAVVEKENEKDDNEKIDPLSNYFVKDGIGSLINKYGEQLKTKFSGRFTDSLNAVVQKIEYGDEGVTVRTSGRSVTGVACIVTVPVSVIAADAIEFVPALPEAFVNAFSIVRLGSYKKLAMKMKMKTIPNEIKVGFNYYILEDEPEGVWQYYRLPHYPTVLVAHAAGDFAAALDQMRDVDVYNLFRETLQEAYEKKIKFTNERAMTNWSKDPHAQGAYSYTANWGRNESDRTALEARRQLKKPLGTVSFAGEASSLDLYGTIAGAYNEGVAAARDLLERMSES